jgi:orotidine-5'-phosphate decarboxylase
MHCDIIDDFTHAFAEELVRLSKELDFIIFEDRKFADIGTSHAGPFLHYLRLNGNMLIDSRR